MERICGRGNNIKKCQFHYPFSLFFPPIIIKLTFFFTYKFFIFLFDLYFWWLFKKWHRIVSLMFAIESALFFSVNRNIVSFQATQSSMMLKSFSFLLFHFTCNNATGEWRLVELNRAHFRRMREEVDYLSPFSQQVPQTLSGLSALCLPDFLWFSSTIVLNSL